MKAGKKEKKQIELVEAWNKEHKLGIDVIVVKDDQTEERTKTRSEAFMLGKSDEYPGHTAVIFLEGISGCYALKRVRPAAFDINEYRRTQSRFHRTQIQTMQNELKNKGA